MRDVIDVFKAARRVSTPLIAISTPDQFALMRRLFKATNGAPALTWDIINGLEGINDAGASQVANHVGVEGGKACVNPVDMLEAIREFDPKSCVVMYNAHRFLEDTQVLQALMNLRDEFVKNHRTLVMLGPDFKLPVELRDVVLIDEAMPDDEQLSAILQGVIDDAYKQPDGEEQHVSAVDPEWVDAVRGLPAFTAEQTFAMATEETRINTEDLWERKRVAINQTPGLTFTRDGLSFSELGGLAAWKEFMRRWVDGDRPGCIVFIDEIEKAFAGTEGDNTGISQDIHGAFLSWMQDSRHTGILAVGPPGSGKTAAGMSIGPELNAPTLKFDVNSTKQSLVGESERNIREAQKVIDSIAGSSYAFVFATCNSERSLSPELKRRFWAGTWFFNLPTKEEREIIWDIYLENFNVDISEQVIPDDHDWTGAEIRNCCHLASTMKCSLEEASKYIVPVAKSSRESVENLRKAASGRWLSAAYPGAYKGEAKERKQRAVSLA